MVESSMGTLTSTMESSVKQATLDQIEQDRRGAPEDVEKLFEIIEQHLFEPALDVRALRPDDLSLRQSRQATWHFRTWLGVDPASYTDRLRMEMACRLVEECDAQVGDIAATLGFRDAGLFTQWFKRRRGLSPQSLRGVRPKKTAVGDNEAQLREARQLLEGGAPVALNSLEALASFASFGRQALVAALGPGDAALVLRFLTQSRTGNE